MSNLHHLKWYERIIKKIVNDYSAIVALIIILGLIALIAKFFLM